MALPSAILAAITGGLQAWNHAQGKVQKKEEVQLGLDIARAEDSKAAATAAKRVAAVMTEQMTDDEIDDLALGLARERDKRKRM